MRLVPASLEKLVLYVAATSIAAWLAIKHREELRRRAIAHKLLIYRTCPLLFGLPRMDNVDLRGLAKAIFSDQDDEKCDESFRLVCNGDAAEAAADIVLEGLGMKDVWFSNLCNLAVADLCDAPKGCCFFFVLHCECDSDCSEAMRLVQELRTQATAATQVLKHVSFVTLMLTRGAAHVQHRNLAMLHAVLLACGAEQLCPRGLLDIDQSSQDVVQQTLVPWLNALAAKLERRRTSA